MSVSPSFLYSDRAKSPDSSGGALSPPALDLRLVPSSPPSWAGLRMVTAAPLLGALWVYRQLVSPALHWAGGPSCGCRFYPTCSAYASEAIRVHGPLTGLFLAVKRLVRCTPLHPGGVDFVPPRSALRRHCVRHPSARPSL